MIYINNLRRYNYINSNACQYLLRFTERLILTATVAINKKGKQKQQLNTEYIESAY